MNKVPLAKTGEMVSPFCLGAMLMGTVTDKATSFEILDRFVDAGGDFIDTANCYAWWTGKGEFVGDESETLLGEWMKARRNRDRVFLATKVGARLKNPKTIRNADGSIIWERVRAEYEYLSAATIRQAVEDSLKRLQTDHIDLYYAHIDDRVTDQEETMEAFEQLVQAGKVRYIGGSNLHTWRLERARNISAAHGWAPYVALQQEYSYFRPKPGTDFGIGGHVDDELLDYLSANQEVALLAYSPLLSGIYDDRQKRENYFRWHLYNGEDTRARLDVLSGLAQELNVSNNQLVLAWLFHHQPSVIPVLGVSSLTQLEQNLQALDIHLTEEQMSVLNKASA